MRIPVILQIDDKVVEENQPLSPVQSLRPQSGLTATDSSRGNASHLRFTVGWYYFLNQLLQFIISIRNPFELTQAQIAKLQTRLTRDDAGTTFFVTDYNHLLLWDGSAFGWPPGDSGSGFEIDFKTAGPVPATGWHACDGTVNVPYLKSDGTLGAQTVSNVAGKWFRR